MTITEQQMREFEDLKARKAHLKAYKAAYYRKLRDGYQQFLEMKAAEEAAPATGTDGTPDSISNR